MASSVEAINKVLKTEGGFVNNPADRGGATNYGITQKVYEEFKGRKVTIDEMRNMPIEDAKAIYKAGYWDKVAGDMISNYSIAYTLFDQAVNRGVNSAIMQAQRILGQAVTGLMNGTLLNALNALKPDQAKSFLNSYFDASEKFYKDLATKDPTQIIFLQGWLNRVAGLRAYAESGLSAVVTSIKENPWIYAVPAVAMAGVITYYLINQRGNNGRNLSRLAV